MRKISLISLIEWKEKMKDINKEYQEKYKLYNIILECTYVCKMCNRVDTYYGIGEHYPLTDNMIETGIMRIYRCICIKCKRCKFVPYPKNY